MTQDNKKIDPRELARSFELQIKQAVAKKFSTSVDDLTLLRDEDAAYLSQEEPDSLCCFVVGQKSGFLYLVIGKIGKDGKSLSDLKSDVVS
ncbi:MAG: hypothetical protein AAB495_04685 [Patescibacteria group bacterium]